MIGGGSGGLTAATIAARVGARVLLVDRTRLGGDCLYSGCVPSKALLASARFASQMRRAREYGIEPADVRVDIAAASGTYEPFQKVAEGALEVFLASHGVEPSNATVERVLDAFAELPAQPDVRPAFEKVPAAGVRVATLTNGSKKATQELLEQAGLGNLVDETISIDDVKRWKPAREVYLHAAKVLDVPPPRLALLAAHAWDVHGAKQAGLVAGFVARKERSPSSSMSTPDVTGASLYLALGWRDELVYHRRRAAHREDILHTVAHLGAAAMFASNAIVRLVDWRRAR